MGVLNVTPDSFSDGGELADVEAVVAAGRRMRDAGACVLDVGGESTRPGAEGVPLDEELRRVVPAVRALVERVGLPVSVDTRKRPVFEEAWDAGASLLNDVSALTHDPEMGACAAETDAAVILMHMRGEPATMDSDAVYEDCVGDVRRELEDRVTLAESAGIARARLAIDPGLGFSKTHPQSLELVCRVNELHDLRLPLIVGPSRKRFVGEITGREHPRERDPGTGALVGHLARCGVEMVRVHAVQPAVDVVRVEEALAAGLT
jgi:dihydropteroate synthase